MNKIVPIILGVSAILPLDVSQTDFNIRQKDVKENLTGLSNEILHYNVFISDLNTTLYMEKKFEIHFKKWKSKTQFQSNINSIISDTDFQQIIGMGKRVIPFILQEINHEPSNLVWALNFITNSTLSKNQHTTLTEACKSWVKWGQKQNLV
jgi:hypothetical protein